MVLVVAANAESVVLDLGTAIPAIPAFRLLASVACHVRVNAVVLPKVLVRLSHGGHSGTGNAVHGHRFLRLRRDVDRILSVDDLADVDMAKTEHLWALPVTGFFSKDHLGQ
jgi:hypothetical protein